jgi:hypothetical protein
MLKKIFTGVWLLLLVSAVAALFWYNDMVYSLPTPQPANYKATPLGTVIKLPGALCGYNNKPLLLHFYNPNCPCSRFNVTAFKSLVTEYRGQVNFAIVVVSKKSVDPQSIRNKFGSDIVILPDASIAKLCGVYSTPQAVLLDKQGKLYYRGNYNRSRYCTDEKTSFARIAIESILNNHFHPVFSTLALRAYGCQLPGCTK